MIQPPPPPRARPLRRGALGVLAILLALGALAWAFDWNWFRPAIQRYVMSHSGRTFEFDQLRVRFAGSLDPTVEFDNLRVQNAPWADQRPLIDARRVAATFSWRTLFDSQTVVSLLVLEDAQVDLERQANGLRNWRLGHPEDTGPQRVKVMAIDASRSRLHTVHGGIGLVADAQISALAAPQPVAGHPDLPLTKQLVFRGTLDGKAIAVDAAVSKVLTFGISSERFAARGTGRLGALRIDADGVATDVRSGGDIEADVTLSSDGAGAPWPLPAALAHVRPLTARAHVKKDGRTWTVDNLRGQLGQHGELAGELMVVDPQADGARRVLRATLHDVVLDLDDLVAPTARSPTGAVAPGAQRPAPVDANEHALSTAPVDLAALRDFDADIDLKNTRFLHGERDLLQSLRGQATLSNGVLKLTALDLGLADGHLTGTAQVDATHSPAELALDLQARGLRIDRLSSKLANNNGLIGAVDGRAMLRSRGDSVRALATAASGTLSALLAPGASVSKRFDAKMSLDGGAWLRSLLDRAERVPVQCAALTLDVDHGIGTTRRFQFETEHTALAGGGSVSFANESLEAAVMPVRKERALLVLDKSVHFSGPWHDIKISLAPPLSAAQPGRCVVAERARAESAATAK